MKAKNIDDLPYETLGQFEMKVAQAIASQHTDAPVEWIETSPEVMAHYQPRGLNGAKFFVYRGIKVCPYGMVEKIEEEMNEPLAQKIFGKEEGVVIRHE